MDQVLHRLAALPGVPEAVVAAREACDRMRRHRALRRQGEPARAEATARAARAGAALDGADLPLAVVRDLLRGAGQAPQDPVGLVARGAVRATVQAHTIGAVLRTAPAQALARLHVAAAAGLVPDDALGRPNAAAPAGRLADLGLLLAAGPDVPALVVAAVAHGEIMTVRPFPVGCGVVARAVHRAVVVDRGLDPTGVAIPEAAWLDVGTPAYLAALAGYASGTAEGMAHWLLCCAEAVVRGAVHGERVADAVLAGRLAG